MLDIKNIPVEKINQNKRQNATFVRMKNQMDVKMASYLRYLGTKNAVNRASDYHYLVLAVTDSTAPVNGIDYIHPSVKPAVDYATAVITKGLVPNGEINFEFVPDSEEDEYAARQATEMVSKVVNQMNDPHFIMERWVMDSAMHKNGMMMIKPIREQIVRYVTTEGTSDQLRAFEQQAADSGLTALRQSRRRMSVDLAAVAAEMGEALATQQDDTFRSTMESRIAGLEEIDDDVMPEDLETSGAEAATAVAEEQVSLLDDAIRRNTIYTAKYKLTGYNINIKFHPIAQHYWICDPTVPEMREQPF